MPSALMVTSEIVPVTTIVGDTVIAACTFWMSDRPPISLPAFGWLGRNATF